MTPLGGHGCGAVGVEGRGRLAERLDEDRRPPLYTVQGKAAVILRQPVDDDAILRPVRGDLVEQLDVQLGLADVHFSRAVVVALRDAVRLDLKRRLRLVRPLDQSIGGAGEARLRHHQPSLLGACIEEAPSGAHEADRKIGGQPKLESVPTGRSGSAISLIDLGTQTFPREQQTPESSCAMQKADIEKWWPFIGFGGFERKINELHNFHRLSIAQ
jgi:hypothetical protein